MVNIPSKFHENSASGNCRNPRPKIRIFGNHLENIYSVRWQALSRDAFLVKDEDFKYEI